MFIRYYCEVVPEIVEAGPHPAYPCWQTRTHEGLRQIAVVGNTWLGSDQDGTLLGKTGGKMKSQVDKTTSTQGPLTCFISGLHSYRETIHVKPLHDSEHPFKLLSTAVSEVRNEQ